VKENAKLNKQKARFEKKILELSEAQKPQTDVVNNLTRKNTSLRKQLEETKISIPSQIEKARN